MFGQRGLWVWGKSAGVQPAVALGVQLKVCWYYAHLPGPPSLRFTLLSLLYSTCRGVQFKSKIRRPRWTPWRSSLQGTILILVAHSPMETETFGIIGIIMAQPNRQELKVS